MAKEITGCRPGDGVRFRPRAHHVRAQRVASRLSEAGEELGAEFAERITRGGTRTDSSCRFLA
ncbi:hypothetical protein [Nonomuraea sp. NPDC050643]|uniref:hypothetical protein n=1 Tax=Nonomuraea sp. NPDC050643 TaxID=3155660 RepID=UPI003405C824